MQGKTNSLAQLEKNIAYSFKNIDLLKEALTHPSNDLAYSNQRLEFLGDSVISTIISERIYCDNPKMDEGKLSSLRASLTSGDYMAYLADKLDLANFLILNNTADANHIRSESSSIADAFESLMAAVFLDSNFQEVKRVVLNIYGLEAIDVEKLLIEQNPRGILQELAAKNQEALSYILAEEKGKDHEKTFRVEVSFRDMLVSGDFCTSKKRAQASAALNLLKKLND